ncbi:hypothetical protein ACFST9_22575 [Hymenobacter monticola]|uniref:Uncharacterized protein n=1 Tax=Hymenobacter monticola TaxID=1705399 RepID=A0ABY4B4N9_9BACT|nr:hypothetical protein [Hymenobacter monticola]UOE34113.1 hypothetical protein MTP16_00330 [Hymenobacter monticola]
MKMKLVFADKRIYWVVLAVLSLTLIAHVLLLNRKFELSTLLHVLWVSSIIYLIYIRSSKALLNIKLWIIVALIASPVLRMAGRFMNEMIQDSAASQVEFYLYRLLSVFVGLILLNWVRNTVTLEGDNPN